MLIPRFVVRLFLAAVLGWSVDIVSGQDYPNKPIRIVAPEPGGGGDFTARLIAQGLAAGFGQQVIVDNRGVLAPEIVAKAPADGYTLICYGATIWMVPLMRKYVPYDTVRDFAPIALANKQPNILVVHPSLPVHSVAELIALAKVKPGVLNYAHVGIGTTTHLAAELFKSMTKVNIVRIPYKGVGAAISDLIGGQVQLMFGTAGSVAPHMKSGRLRALAVTSAQPSLLLPGLPTVTATGLPGYESVALSGVLAPAGTTATLVHRLNQEIVRVLSQPDVRQKFLDAGVEPAGGTPEEFAATIRSEIAKWGKVIRNAGIHED